MMIISPHFRVADVLTLDATFGSGTSNDFSLPIYGLYDYGVSGNIRLQSELGSIPRAFTAIEVDLAGYTTPYTYNNQDIYICHTSLSTFDSDPAIDLSDMNIRDLTKVVNAQTVTITAAGWKKITFDTPFYYNGVDNIIIKWENRDGSWDVNYGYAETNASATNRGFEQHQDTTFPTGNAVRTSAVYNIKLHY